jgi:integrase
MGDAAACEAHHGGSGPASNHGSACVFPSAAGTPLDESNVRKAFNLMLDKAELHRRGPHQMRHTFASLLLLAGEPITYVSRQLRHKDSAITLRVDAHWLPDTSTRKGVDRQDESSPAVAHSLHTPARLPLRHSA